MKVTKEASDITARVWHKGGGILWLEYDYLVVKGNKPVTFKIEVPITDKNKHFEIGDEIAIAMYLGKRKKNIKD